MANQVHLISAASLLNENYRRELRSTGRLRPMASESDILWQQMPLKFFGSMIEHKSLYFRAYGEYTEYDEMRFRDFVIPFEKDVDSPKVKLAKSKIEGKYEEFEKKLYISCWYTSPDLSDVGFKTYAQDKSGIAIGTTVKDLQNLLNAAMKKKYKNFKIQNILCGNVQYVPQKDMNGEVLFDPAQMYAPIFLKGYQFQMDQEFRVCVELAGKAELVFNSDYNVLIRHEMETNSTERVLALPHKPSPGLTKIAEDIALLMKGADWPIISDRAKIYLPIELSKLIKFIAVKDDGIFHEILIKCGSKGITSIFEDIFHIKMQEVDSGGNGFLIFQVIKFA